MASSGIVVSDKAGPPATVAGLNLDAVRALVQREISEQNLTLGEFPEDWQAGSGFDAQLLQAGSAPEVLEMVTARGSAELTADNIAAAFRRIALRPKTITETMLEDWRLPRFMRSATTVIARSDLAPHHVATMFWAIAVLREPLPAFQDFLPELCDRVPEVAPEMNVQNLTSCLSAAAKLHQRAPEVLDVVGPLLDEIVGQASTMDAGQVSSIIWALGELNLPEDKIDAVMGGLLRDLSPERLRSFKPWELTNLVWGLANVGTRDVGLLQAVADTVGPCVPEMEKKEVFFDLPMLVLGFQRLLFQDRAFLQIVAQRLLKKKVLRKLNNWGLAALAWSWPDLGDDIPGGDLRTVREVLNQLVAKRRLRRADVENCVKGPSRWMDERWT